MGKNKGLLRIYATTIFTLSSVLMYSDMVSAITKAEAGSVVQSASQEWMLKGRILEADTNEPIPGAAIQISGHRGGGNY